jgi:hypothetical protein
VKISACLVHVVSAEINVFLYLYSCSYIHGAVTKCMAAQQAKVPTGHHFYAQDTKCCYIFACLLMNVFSCLAGQKAKKARLKRAVEF